MPFRRAVCWTRRAGDGTIEFDSPFVRLWVEWEVGRDVLPASDL
jgi:hypothetical protein